MPDYTLIESDSDATHLARTLNDDKRTRPAAVVTIAAGQPTPYIDVDALARELRGLVDVYLIATGPHTWTFSHTMSEGTQVYGGAGRVYPLGQHWVTDLTKSPLRFAWGRADGRHTTQRLIDDGLDMAASAGLLGGKGPTSPSHVRKHGVVKRAENERAWVDFGGGGLDMGVVPPQLAEPDLPIERVLQPGMAVHGVLDPETRWFDIRESRLSPTDALFSYQIGDVVLAEIADVHAQSATALLLPSVAVTLRPDDVTPDAADLRALLTPGEVVTARVLATTPWWLTLLDVDEEPLPAASIYPGGPAWLHPATDAEPDPETSAEPPVIATPERPGLPGEGHELKPAPRPSPAHLVRGLTPKPPPGAAAATEPSPGGVAVRDMSLKVDQLKAQNATLTQQMTALREELTSLRYEREQLAALKSDAERRSRRAEAELKRSRVALRRASSGHRTAEPRFADAEQGLRHLVEASWARRIPVAEQSIRPLIDYTVGPQFMDTVAELEGITPDKIADVVMELVTGIAETSPGRDMHRLRQGAGGDEPALRRDNDGAICWRIALQVNTPSARRLHAWKRPDGRWELSSVRKHDDFNP